jgi:hypothetical protein
MNLKLGPFILMKIDEHPAYLKAEKLARTLTENDIDLILTGKMHLHGNPRRKPKEEKHDSNVLNVPTVENPSVLGVETIRDDVRTDRLVQGTPPGQGRPKNETYENAKEGGER